MKRILVGVAAILGIVLVIGSTIYLSNKFLAKSSSEVPSSSSCQGNSVSHTVTIKNNHVSPEHTDGTICDTLTITNSDESIRLIAFGQHDNHVSYDGVTQKTLDKNQSLMVTFNQTGTFTFHDHFEDSVQGSFTVR